MNIEIVNDYWTDRKGNLFLGWSPSESAEEILAEVEGEYHTAFGHWDVDERSPSYNMIPTKSLSKLGVKTAYTGHDHRARTFTRDGVDVIVTGSMTGYAHGEGDPYITLSLDELKTTDVRYKCVRLRLKEGEVLDEIPDCLSWQVENPPKGEVPQVEIGDFNLSSIYEAKLGGRVIVQPVREKVDQKWQETFMKQD